jgi:DNA-directed RNA polymerase subunit M/transcription elongation factor TFIIS
MTNWSMRECCPNEVAIVLPIDPTADRARRAWLECPRCKHGRACATHWQYLLSNQGTLVHMQCPTCAYLWSTDTRRRAMRQRRAA